MSDDTKHGDEREPEERDAGPPADERGEEGMAEAEPDASPSANLDEDPTRASSNDDHDGEDDANDIAAGASNDEIITDPAHGGDIVQ